MFKEYRDFSKDLNKKDAWYSNLTKDKNLFIKKLPNWLKFDRRLNLIYKYIPEGSLILDMGCGSGDWVNSLIKLKYKSIGVDLI